MSEVLSLPELTSQHSVKIIRTDSTENLRAAELHRETCRLSTWKSHLLFCLATPCGGFDWPLSLETMLRVRVSVGTQHNGSSLGQSFSISADFQFSSTSVSPPMAYLSDPLPSPSEGLRFLIPAAYLPASPPFWSVTLGSLL